MILAVILLVILLIMAYFYLKCSVLASFSTMMTLVIASFLTFTFYEKLAELLILQGYGIQWAHAGCFVLLFIASFALLRILNDLLIGKSTIDLGTPMKIGFAIGCGLISGLIVSGVIIVTLNLAPSSKSFFRPQFKSSSPLNLTTGLFSAVSRGSMSSGKSFSLLHAEFLSQLDSNRVGIEHGVLPIASKNCLQLPLGNTKKPVRIWDIPNKGKFTVVRVGISTENIEDDGAANPAHRGKVEFYPMHLRMICKEDRTNNPLGGSGKTAIPYGFMKDGNFSKITPFEQVNTDAVKIGNDSKVLWLDVAFKVPDGYNDGVLLQFKQNAIIQLPKAEISTEEIEKALDSTEIAPKP